MARKAIRPLTALSCGSLHQPPHWNLPMRYLTHTLSAVAISLLALLLSEWLTRRSHASRHEVD